MAKGRKEKAKKEEEGLPKMLGAFPVPGSHKPEPRKREAPREVDETLDKTRRSFVLGLIAALAFLSFLIFRPFISYVFMAGLFVYLAYPLQRRIERRLKSPAWSALVVLLVSLVLFAAPLVWVGYELVKTVSGFSGSLNPDEIGSALHDSWANLATTFGLPPPTEEEARALVARAIEGVQAYAAEHAGDALAFAGSLGVGMVVFLFVVFYGLVDGPRLIAYAREASPLDDELDNELIGEVRKTVDAVFLGHIIVSVIQGLLGGIGLLIFGVPGVVFWTFVMIILSLIPLVGAFLVWAPAGIYLLATGHTWQGVGLLLWGGLLVSTIDNFLRPKIVGTRADIHPVTVLVGVLGGLSAFGFIGFVLGPLVLAMLVAVINFWRRDFLPEYERRHALDRDSVRGVAQDIAGAFRSPDAPPPEGGTRPPEEG